MKPLVAIILLAALAACAIATGQGAVALIGTKTEVRREVAASAPIIEEVLIQPPKPPTGK